MTTFSLYCQYIGEIKRSMSRDEKLTSYSLGEGVKGAKSLSVSSDIDYFT